jgi:hypothetical protein
MTLLSVGLWRQPLSSRTRSWNYSWGIHPSSPWTECSECGPTFPDPYFDFLNSQLKFRTEDTFSRIYYKKCESIVSLVLPRVKTRIIWCWIYSPSYDHLCPTRRNPKSPENDADSIINIGQCHKKLSCYSI